MVALAGSWPGIAEQSVALAVQSTMGNEPLSPLNALERSCEISCGVTL